MYPIIVIGTAVLLIQFLIELVQVFSADRLRARELLAEYRNSFPNGGKQ